MPSRYSNIEIVDKDTIEQMHFPLEDVLKAKEEILQREHDLETAMKLGNNYKGKVKIVFQDDKSVKQVETTVWGHTDDTVLLKHSLAIPINRIHEIKII